SGEGLATLRSPTAARWACADVDRNGGSVTVDPSRVRPHAAENRRAQTRLFAVRHHRCRHPRRHAGVFAGAGTERHVDRLRRRLAAADVRAVPAGKYAKAALEKLGAWTAAAPKFAMAENVRAALTLVGRGEAPLGIVYETDARAELNVKIVGRFPEDSHPPIVY